MDKTHSESLENKYSWREKSQISIWICVRRKNQKLKLLGNPECFQICGGVMLVWCPQPENQEKLRLEWEREVDQYLWDHSRSFGVHSSEITMD